MMYRLTLLSPDGQDLALWDGVSGGEVVIYHVDHDRCDHFTYINPMLGNLGEGHASSWTDQSVMEWLKRGTIVETNNSCPMPFVSLCASCDAPLRLMDYLCKDCRAA